MYELGDAAVAGPVEEESGAVPPPCCATRPDPALIRESIAITAAECDGLGATTD